jgi:hypothetical protein
MDNHEQWNRLAERKARLIRAEMAAEGLSRADAPNKMRSVIAREAAIARRLAHDYRIDPPAAQLLLQIALGEERVARVGCREIRRGRSVIQAVAAITVCNGDEYVLAR